MDMYWPASTLSESERIQKTANRVGLSVPGETVIKEVEESERPEMPKKNGLIDLLMGEQKRATG